MFTRPVIGRFRVRVPAPAHLRLTCSAGGCSSPGEGTGREHVVTDRVRLCSLGLRRRTPCAQPASYGLLCARLPETTQLDPDLLAHASDAVLRTATTLAGPEHALEAARTVVAWAHGFITMELAGASASAETSTVPMRSASNDWQPPSPKPTPPVLGERDLPPLAQRRHKDRSCGPQVAGQVRQDQQRDRHRRHGVGGGDADRHGQRQRGAWAGGSGIAQAPPAPAEIWPAWPAQRTRLVGRSALRPYGWSRWQQVEVAEEAGCDDEDDTEQQWRTEETNHGCRPWRSVPTVEGGSEYAEQDGAG